MTTIKLRKITVFGKKHWLLYQYRNELPTLLVFGNVFEKTALKTTLGPSHDCFIEFSYCVLSWFWLTSATARPNPSRLLPVGLFEVQSLCQQATDSGSLERQYSTCNGRYSARNTTKSDGKCRKTSTLRHSLWRRIIFHLI